MKINSDQLLMLKKIYNRDFYYMDTDTPREEVRIVKSLKSLGLISEKRGGIYHISTKGFITLAEHGIGEKIIIGLQDFLVSYKGKVNWQLSELKQFAEIQGLTEKEFKYSIQIGNELKLITKSDYTAGSLLPAILEITPNGENYAKDPEPFLACLDLDEREFKTDFPDELILEWLQHSSHETEDFEIEFKINVPPSPDLRNSISGLANYASGVIGIGFNDVGSIIGLDDPDEARRRVFDATRNMKNLDRKTRVIENEEGKKGLILVIARGTQPILIGETMIIRDGTSFRPANAAEVIKFMKGMQTSPGGHLWLKSLRNFQIRSGG